MADCTMKQFFESTVPGRRVEVSDMVHQINSNSGYASYYLRLPSINLICETEICGGERVFEAVEAIRVDIGKTGSEFARYCCRNCKINFKTYSIRYKSNDDKKTGEIYKYGEEPPFGPPVPSRLISLVGPERDYFLKGRKSEFQGLGIAAFAYYRRVIENQKNRIFDQIIKVSSKVGASKELLSDLEAAKKETQFSRSVSHIKHGLPQVLLMDGHNPILLLHSALSEGLHAQSDEECLQLASSVRVVMTELADRIALALKDEAELIGAVSKLLAKKQQ